jgi:superfamily II DNA helicase RecQ
VHTKPDGKGAVIEQMALFIKTKYPRGAGIVYTYSRKDADTVASCLCDYGVIAEVSSREFGTGFLLDTVGIWHGQY